MVRVNNWLNREFVPLTPSWPVLERSKQSLMEKEKKIYIYNRDQSRHWFVIGSKNRTLKNNSWMENKIDIVIVSNCLKSACIENVEVGTKGLYNSFFSHYSIIFIFSTNIISEGEIQIEIETFKCNIIV